MRRPFDPSQPDDLPERVAAFPEVEDCYSVAGEASYVLKVRTRTTAELEDLIRRLRERVGIATRTTIALSIPFEGRPAVSRKGFPAVFLAGILAGCACTTRSVASWRRSAPSRTGT